MFHQKKLAYFIFQQITCLDLNAMESGTSQQGVKGE